MTEDGVMVLANGGVADRAAVVEALRGAPVWQRVGIDSARVGTAGDDAAPPGVTRPALRGAPVWQRFEIDSARVVTAGNDAAALVYTGRAWREESAPPFVGAMTSTYVRTDGGWRLALYTQTPIP